MTKVSLSKRFKIPIFLFVFLAITGFLSWKYFYQNFTVVEVIDGDTIKINDARVVRYISLDAAEKDECFSQEAKAINAELTLGKTVRLEMDTNEMDRFGRYLAYVYVQDETGKEVFVNQYLLGEGTAEFFLDTVNIRYQAILVQAAEQAHKEKRGLWSVCAPDPKVGCQIKGNLDRLDKRWYHLPSFRHYEQVIVNPEHGDRWFCTEEQAQTAGFKRARE